MRSWMPSYRTLIWHATNSTSSAMRLHAKTLALPSAWRRCRRQRASCLYKIAAKATQLAPPLLWPNPHQIRWAFMVERGLVDLIVGWKTDWATQCNQHQQNTNCLNYLLVACLLIHQKPSLLASTRRSWYLCMCIYVCMCVCVSTRATCVCVSTYVCMHVCIYTYMYVCMYVRM